VKRLPEVSLLSSSRKKKSRIHTLVLRKEKKLLGGGKRVSAYFSLSRLRAQATVIRLGRGKGETLTDGLKGSASFDTLLMAKGETEEEIGAFLPLREGQGIPQKRRFEEGGGVWTVPYLFEKGGGGGGGIGGKREEGRAFIIHTGKKRGAEVVEKSYME